MKSKLSWISFIPLAIAACFFKLAPMLLPGGSVFGLTALQMEYCYLGAVALIFIFSLIFTLADRKIAKYHVPHRNVLAGIFALLAAVAIAADGSDAFMHMFSSGIKDVLTIFDAVFAILSAIVFIILGLNSFSRNRDNKRFSLLYVLPAFLCAVRMIISFVGFTTISIRLADVSILVCYIFATLFFYYHAVTLAMIKTKNAVKCCFLFGLPAVAAMLPYSAYRLIYQFDTQSILNNLEAAEIAAMGLYILFVLIEMTLHVKKSFEIVAKKEEEIKADPEEKVDDFLASSVKEDETDDEVESDYLASTDTEDFLYREVPREDDEQVTVAADDEANSYLTDVVEEDPETDDRPKNYEDRLDEIDKLILSITENGN